MTAPTEVSSSACVHGAVCVKGRKTKERYGSGGAPSYGNWERLRTFMFAYTPSAKAATYVVNGCECMCAHA